MKSVPVKRHPLQETGPATPQLNVPTKEAHQQGTALPDLVYVAFSQSQLVAPRQAKTIPTSKTLAIHRFMDPQLH